MKFFISLFAIILLAGSPTVSPAGMNTFLEDYPERGRRTWLKVDPPVMEERGEESIQSKAGSLVDGIYVQFDRAGHPRALMICEVRFFEKGPARAEKKVDTSQWSSQLAMIAQYYDEAADSFRSGNYVRSTKAPEENRGSAVPGYPDGNVSIWFDTQKRRWTLFGPGDITGSETARRIRGLSLYLKKAAGRSIPYVYERYTATLSDEGRIRVMDAESLYIQPPGRSPIDPMQDPAAKHQAGIRKDLLGEFLASATAAGESPSPAAAGPGLPPLGDFKAEKRASHTSRTSLFPFTASPGHDMRGFRKLSARQHLFYALSQRTRPDFPYPLSGDPKHGSGFIGLSGVEGRGDGLYGNAWLNEPRGPVMDVRAGILIGAGVGMEATFLGMSILPAGGAAYVSTLSGLVGGASIMTGGVILAAAAAGASIQYLLHLQDVKVERKRVERLLEGVSLEITQDEEP